MKEMVEVVWPSGRRHERQSQPAPRLDTLANRTICGLYNGAFQFEETWPLVKQLLAARYPGVRFVDWPEFGIFYGKHEASLLEALPARLKEYHCDAVITGRGC
ncbi:MAG: hypothetical protein HYX90_01895 [Chloroflexi bacterium]|nr:hypothetical protein [Chloroflexota bacterium]